VCNPFAAWGGYLEPTSHPHTRYYTKANIHNDYLVDHRLARNELMIGIPFLVNLQHRAMTETMGPIYDRTQEHLGTTDAMVIYVRRRLIDAARALRDQSVVPANVDDPTMCRVARPPSCCPRATAGSRRRRRRANPTRACPLPGCRSPSECGAAGPRPAPGVLRGRALSARGRIGRVRRCVAAACVVSGAPRLRRRGPPRSWRPWGSSSRRGSTCCGSCGTAARRSPSPARRCGAR